MNSPTLKDVVELLAELEQRDTLIRHMADCIERGGPINWLDFVTPEQRDLFEKITETL